MQVGLQFFPALSPEDKSPEAYFQECLDLASAGEDLGFSHARVVEHYFEPYGGYSPNPIVLLSAISQRTRKMRLVTGAVLPVFNHPLKLAGEIGMLDAISRGRVDVGVARAFLLHEFRRFNIPVDESRARFEEGLAQIELLLSENNVTHEGRFHRIEGTTSLPRPTQQPRPKFFIAANQTEETFVFAGRNGHSLMALPIGEKLRPLLEAYRSAWRDAGHPGDGEVMLAFHMFAHTDAQRAREIAKGPFLGYFKYFAEATADWASGSTSRDYPGYGATMAKVKNVSLEQQIDAGAAWVGTPDQIRTTIKQVVDLVGPFEHASLQVTFGRLPFEEAQRSMRLFAAEVLPTLTQGGKRH